MQTNKTTAEAPIISSQLNDMQFRFANMNDDQSLMLNNLITILTRLSVDFEPQCKMDAKEVVPLPPHDFIHTIESELNRLLRNNEKLGHIIDKLTPII